MSRSKFGKLKSSSLIKTVDDVDSMSSSSLGSSGGLLNHAARNLAR